MKSRDWTYLIRALDGTVWVLRKQPPVDKKPMSLTWDDETGSRAVRGHSRHRYPTKTAWFREVPA
jgi:hypothetical protein